MKLRSPLERRRNTKAREILVAPTQEEFSSGVDFAQLRENNKKGFYKDLKRPNNRPLYYLNLLSYLSVLEPETFEQETKTDGHDFAFYKDQLIEQSQGGTQVPDAVRLLSRLFPNSRKEMTEMLDLPIKSFFRSTVRNRRLPREIQETIQTGVSLLFLLPERQTEIRTVLQPFVEKWLSASGKNWRSQLSDCYIADPSQRERIRAELVLMLPQIKEEIVDQVSAYWIMADLRILEADNVEVTSDSRIVLTKEDRFSNGPTLPERNLAV